MTLNTPMSELRRTAIDRILVISHDGALRKILQRLFFSDVLDLLFHTASVVDLCLKVVGLVRRNYTVKSGRIC